MRGVSPGALGLKAVAELAIPVTAGALAGYLLARATLPWFAPSIQIDASAHRSAIFLVAAVVALGLAGLGLSAAARVRGVHERRPISRRPLRFVPWELLFAGLCVWSWSRLSGGAIVRVRGEVVPYVDPFALAFPLLVAFTAAAVAARLTGWGLLVSHRLDVWRMPPPSSRCAGWPPGAAPSPVSSRSRPSGSARWLRGPPSRPPSRRGWNARSTSSWGRGPTSRSRRAPRTPSPRCPPPSLRVTWHDGYSERPLDELMAILGAPPRDGVYPALSIGSAPTGTELVLDDHLRANPDPRVLPSVRVDSFPRLGRDRSGLPRTPSGTR